ncbi:MAG: hypothetical protein AAF224_14955 [Pseudomonadota bacterium]
MKLNALLQTDVTALNLDAARSVGAWLKEGFRGLVPRVIRSKSFQPVARLLLSQNTENDRPEELAEVICENPFGEKKRAELAGSIEGLSAHIRLDDREYYSTSLSLPKQAAKTLYETVGLRLSEISPLPTEQIGYAVGVPQSADDGRIDVPIGIVRKSTIANIAERHNDKADITIGANPDSNGDFDLVFFKSDSNARRKQRVTWAKSASLAAALLLLIAAIDSHLTKRGAALSAYEVQLMQELKAHRKITTVLDSMTEQERTLSQFTDLNAEIEYLRAAATNLGDDIALKRYSFENGERQIEAYAPSATATPADMAATRFASKRPGYDEFRLNIVEQ